MPDTQTMRERVSKAYSGEAWKTKVREMPDNQIIAVYYRMLKKGTLKGAAR